MHIHGNVHAHGGGDGGTHCYADTQLKDLSMDGMYPHIACESFPLPGQGKCKTHVLNKLSSVGMGEHELNSRGGEMGHAIFQKLTSLARSLGCPGDCPTRPI